MTLHVRLKTHVCQWILTKVVSKYTKRSGEIQYFSAAAYSALRGTTNVISRSNLQTRMAEPTSVKVSKDKSVFRFGDYDCIGFDLDNTICRYKLAQMVKLEYGVLAEYLVTQKGYNADYLMEPLEGNLDFLQKGLVLDFHRGNILKLGSNGYISKGSHGTNFLTDAEIESIYGPDRKWDMSVAFCQDMLEAWSGPLSERIRKVTDYFDMSVSVVFGRIVDSLDAREGNKLESYNVWPDILDGLAYMFRRENFSSNEGGYFPALKKNPEMYINKCSSNVINWLKQIRDSKIVFLLTGSNVDFASFTATYSLGENWRDLFDIVLCYTRKPGFFTDARPFIKLDGVTEMDPVNFEDLEFGNIYSQGNWEGLYHFLSKKTGLQHPKCLYVGDNLIQDIYVPSSRGKCDTVAVIEELGAEGMKSNDSYFHSDASVIVSSGWGSYFGTKETGNSFCSDVIKNHSKICVPDLDVLAKLPLTFEFQMFSEGEEKSDCLGYYPGYPRGFW